MPTHNELGLRNNGADTRKIKVLTSFSYGAHNYIERGMRKVVEVPANSPEPTLHLGVLRVLQDQHGFLVHDVKLMKLFH